ncbi:MAG: YqgE/AlgH family protein [Nonlabens sp.]|nr:YqgE/AlgH family protein [Nonlabens sp.]MDP5099974.1 YqgE/AlgH family protein [Nonlabens sp.]
MKSIKPSRGKILLSEPSIIGDASFSRSVILLTEYNEHGVVGFILNKPVTFTLDELIPEVTIKIPVYQGGPVDVDNLYFLHKVPELIKNSHLIHDSIYWGGDFNKAIELLLDGTISNNQIKFFLGYSGWELEQLQEELDASSWLVLQEQKQDSTIFNTEVNGIWRDKMKKLGGSYEFWSNAPDNPTYN